MTNETPAEPQEIRIDISRELVDLAIMLARTFESLSVQEVTKLRRMLEAPIIAKKDAATVGALAMGCGFIFAMQLRELQRARNGEAQDDDSEP